MICCSEHTYLAHGPSEEAVVRFEASADYQALLGRSAELASTHVKQTVKAERAEARGVGFEMRSP